jgi:hypothetical protein
VCGREVIDRESFEPRVEFREKNRVELQVVGVEVLGELVGPDIGCLTDVARSQVDVVCLE